MEYPLISEYKEAILSAEDNFNELASLRPVLDSHGDPVMSSGNFAVVFKMRDENNGKLYAVKCFIKDQEGRDESYRKIADELETVSSSYILPLRYLENELFVDSAQCDREEFPVVVMEWVEGKTLDAYLKRNLNDKYELEMLSYRFNRMAAWLLAQPFAHGDLKPDNILVYNDGSLVMVDYDGMFMPSMKGEKAREIGSPDYRHPSRTDADFDEHIDDFSISVIALSLKAIALNPNFKSASSDSLLLSEKDYRNPSNSIVLKDIQSIMDNSDLSLLFGAFSISLAKNSLELVSFRLFMTQKPTKPKIQQIEILSIEVTEKDIEEGVADEFGVIYSKDGKRLLNCESSLNLKEYIIKPGTQVICIGAFWGCNLLQNVTIPNSVTSIGSFAFYECKSLESVIISKSVTYIENDIFWCCESLKSITIPDSVTSIGDRAFGRCKLLESVTIPDSVISIGDSAFCGCESLESVTIPDSVTIIGEKVFSRCKSLKDVKIPNTIATIGEDSFWECVSLQSMTIPNSITAIGDNAFEGCKSLRLVTIPDSITSIGNSAFCGCESLESVTIPDSVTIIGKKVFSGCKSLKDVKIPNSITTIGEGSFWKCVSLQSVTIPDFITAIGDSVFEACKSLRLVTIPDSVKTIGNSAFCGCKLLESMTISKSVTKIGERTFERCESLQSISIPNSVNSIGDFAFYGCYSLKNILIPESVTIIGDCAFMQCYSLQSVIIPDSVVIIGERAFSLCHSLKMAEIPRSIAYIGDKFPSNCSIIRHSIFDWNKKDKNRI